MGTINEIGSCWKSKPAIKLAVGGHTDADGDAGEVANSSLAPAAGAVNVTAAPLTGIPIAVTVATNGAANALPTMAL